MELSASLHAAVYGDDSSLVDGLGGVGRSIEELVRIDPDTAELATLYEESLATLEELGRRLSAYHNSVEHDPRRLAELRSRLDLIHRLKGKYGNTVDEVLAAGAAARREPETADRSELDLEALEREETAAMGRVSEEADRLSAARAKAGSELEAAVSAALPDLGMDGGVFRIVLESLAEVGPSGRERVEFQVSLNPGFEPGPLSRVASGGELSRVMLALKSVLAEVDEIPCLVFDEIDSGVGGRVAHRVASSLAEVARRHQVFAVTHLPQIASRADSHLQVEKLEIAGRAAASVRLLEGEERVEELARMLGGDPESAASRQHAADLLS
jgi:DNA repair protein RecN (Recombination protein N)